jgi:hypothetical protein
MYYYAKSTRGFYSIEIHGDNIPSDAVEITTEEHAALLAGQSAGQIIVADADGKPVLQDPPPITGNALLLSQITTLEATITPRRQREAILGIDNGWLADVNAQIATLRAKLK